MTVFLASTAICISVCITAAVFLDDLIGQVKLEAVQRQGSFGPGGGRL